MLNRNVIYSKSASVFIMIWILIRSISSVQAFNELEEHLMLWRFFAYIFQSSVHNIFRHINADYLLQMNIGIIFVLIDTNSIFSQPTCENPHKIDCNDLKMLNLLAFERIHVGLRQSERSFFSCQSHLRSKASNF